VAKQTTETAGAPPLTAEDAAAEPGARPDHVDEGARQRGRSVPWVVTTYFAEGLPFSIVHQVSAELFTSFHASLQAVGYTSLYGIAWNFKFVWSPLVERYGSLRRWILAMELLLAAVLAAVASRAGAGDIRAVAIALVFVAFLGATQDVAVDGHYIDALDKPAQASLSGLRVGAYRVALLVGKSGLVALAGYTTWKVSFLAGAGIMAALAIANRWLLAAPAGKGAARSGEGAASRDRKDAVPAFLESFWSFLRKPRIAWIIAFVILFKAGDALLFNMSVKFLDSLGLDLHLRGILNAPSLVASVAGTTFGGMWIRRAGLRRTLVPAAAVQTFAIPIYTVLAELRPSFAIIASAVAVEQFVAGIGNAALLVFLMRLAEGPHRTSHFAIGTALMTVPLTLIGLVSGDLVQALGFARFFVLAFVISVPGVFLARVVPKD
jgi:PAT family beta-lactamase induction signal transducer AmpG